MINRNYLNHVSYVFSYLATYTISLLRSTSSPNSPRPTFPHICVTHTLIQNRTLQMTLFQQTIASAHLNNDKLLETHLKNIET